MVIPSGSVSSYGHVRISSKNQEFHSSIESQKQDLVLFGVREENIFVEVGSAANEIMATMLSAIAEFENNRRKKRQRQEILVAQKNGKKSLIIFRIEYRLN